VHLAREQLGLAPIFRQPPHQGVARPRREVGIDERPAMLAAEDQEALAHRRLHVFALDRLRVCDPLVGLVVAEVDLDHLRAHLGHGATVGDSGQAPGLHVDVQHGARLLEQVVGELWQGLGRDGCREKAGDDQDRGGDDSHGAGL
jgi:hypothetical protein